jgi:hypothetical protein
VNMPLSPVDLEPSEQELHRILAAVPPVAPPFGFRDQVMTRIAGDGRVAWEWIVAALFAVPSIVYLARLLLVHGQEIALAFSNIVSAASTDTTDAFFFIDGLTVIALALLGIACAFAAHALLVSGGTTRTAAR